MHTQHAHVHVTLTHTHKEKATLQSTHLLVRKLYISLFSKISHVYKSIQGYSLQGNNKLNNQLMIISRRMIN